MSSLTVQKALFAALSGDAALMAAVTGVFDGVRAGARLPYVTIGPDTATDAGWKGGAATDHRLTVTVWDAGPGTASAKAIMALCETALAAVADEVDGIRIVWLRVAKRQVASAADGATQGIIELRGRSETAQ
jgi:hypothetical protein